MVYINSTCANKTLSNGLENHFDMVSYNFTKGVNNQKNNLYKVIEN